MRLLAALAVRLALAAFGLQGGIGHLELLDLRPKLALARRRDACWDRGGWSRRRRACGVAFAGAAFAAVFPAFALAGAGGTASGAAGQALLGLPPCGRLFSARRPPPSSSWIVPLSSPMAIEGAMAS